MTFVRPHATDAEWPIGKPGIPGSDAPATCRSPPATSATYHRLGTDWPRCGSFATIGIPDSDRLGPTTQLFDADEASGEPPSTSVNARNSAVIGPSATPRSSLQ